MFHASGVSCGTGSRDGLRTVSGWESAVVDMPGEGISPGAASVASIEVGVKPVALLEAVVGSNPTGGSWN